MKRKVYLSGQITGLHQDVAEKMFEQAEYEMGQLKFDQIINPMKLDHQNNSGWADYMKTDIKALLDCSHIYMIRGWEKSRGARLEFQLAYELGIVIIFQK